MLNFISKSSSKLYFKTQKLLGIFQNLIRQKPFPSLGPKPSRQQPISNNRPAPQQQATWPSALCPAPLSLTCRAHVSAAPRTVSPPSLETDTERQLLPNSRRYASGPKPTTPPLLRTCPAASHQPGVATVARSPRTCPPRFPAPAPYKE